MGFLVVGTWGLAVAFGLLFVFVRFIPLSASFSLCTYALGHDSMIEAFCRSFCCSRSHCDLSVERERCAPFCGHDITHEMLVQHVACGQCVPFYPYSLTIPKES
jgi:hypothetical protein